MLKIKRELDELEKGGVTRKDKRLECASLIVVVPKADKSIRISGDYKVTIHQSVENEQYPLPKYLVGLTCPIRTPSLVLTKKKRRVPHS